MSGSVWPEFTVQENETSYFINELIKWLNPTEFESQSNKSDLVRIYDKVDPVLFRSHMDYLIKEYEFPPILTIKVDDLSIHSTERLRQYQYTGISCHLKILYSLYKLLKKNIPDIFIEASNYFQIPEILNNKDYYGELKIIPLIHENLQMLLEDEHRQLIPNLYYHNGAKGLLSKEHYSPSISGGPNTRYTFEYVFSKTSSDIFTKQLIHMLVDRYNLLSKIYKSRHTNIKTNSRNKVEWTIKDIIHTDNLEDFYGFETSFIANGSIQKEKDGSFKWVEKPISSLIAFIIILYEQGYINKMKFETHHKKCIKIFEERYHKKLIQAFEAARIKRQRIKIDEYKQFPVYCDIEPLKYKGQADYWTKFT